MKSRKNIVDVQEKKVIEFKVTELGKNLKKESVGGSTSHVEDAYQVKSKTNGSSSLKLNGRGQAGISVTD